MSASRSMQTVGAGRHLPKADGIVNESGRCLWIVAFEA